MSKRAFLALCTLWGVCGSLAAQGPTLTLAPNPPPKTRVDPDQKSATAVLGLPDEVGTAVTTPNVGQAPKTVDGASKTSIRPNNLPPGSASDEVWSGKALNVDQSITNLPRQPEPGKTSYPIGGSLPDDVWMGKGLTVGQPTTTAPRLPDVLDAKYTENYLTLPHVPQDSPSTNCPNPLFENLSIQLALDGSKEPVDLGVNANFGFRVAFNWGIPIDEDLGIGLQLGTALNYSRTATRIFRQLDGPTDRLQSFTTLGLFRRSESGWDYGFVYDFRFDDSFDHIDASQWRVHLSKHVDDFNEIGVFGSWRDRIDRTTVAGQPLFIRPINQVALFWRHLWENDIVTRAWVGMAEEHGRFSLLKPGERSIDHPFTFGADFHVPLSNSLALFGEAHFITPNDTGTVTATLGIAWYPGGGARTTTRSRFAPLLPLANNPFFALDAQQQ